MKTLLLIDANALIHRAYHALPPLTSPTGEPIGAIYGLASALLKILKEQKPDYIAAAFDRPEPTFREELFKEYKAHRPPIAEELAHQLVKAHELFQKFGVPSFELNGYEADDIIATLVSKFKETKDLKIVILTGDLDTLQLVEKNKVVVQAPKKGLSETLIYNERAVVERFGLPPKKMPDYKALVGDPSDNVPGVPGVGPKTAAKLLQDYKTLENLFRKLGENPRLKEKLERYSDQTTLSKKLVTLVKDVPLEVKLKDLNFRGMDPETTIKYFEELGFQSLVKRILKDGAPRGAEVEPQREPPPEAVIIPSPAFALEKKEELSSSKIKIALDWKEIFKTLLSKNIPVAPPIFDVRVAGWLLNPDEKDFSLDALSRRFFYHGAEGEDTIGLLSKFFAFFSAKIKDYGLRKVFEEIEMPLVEILARIEEWGVGLNIPKLRELEKEISSELERLAKEIYDLAGAVFNINSSKQLSGVLFEKLGLKPGVTRRTKSGLRSTSFEVLKELKDKHPLIPLVLEYRENFKINSTFVKPLIDGAGPDSRIRTTFIQTGTATGRLASEKPNLQNLPQESKWSRALRGAFEAPASRSLVAFDYSQLELRLLAHVSGDKKLKRAFLEGADAHRLTAAQVFNVAPENVTEAMRRVGKTLNFGVIYGMGARAFAETSGLPLPKASQFIEEYFRDFPDVKNWQDRIKNEARTSGFIKNENGRRRWFLNTAESYREDEMERAAVNMPIQSLEADIIKLAMIESFKKLKEKGWLGGKAKLVLTIHDELLFEVGNDILKEILAAIPPLMENVYKISVPLIVETRVGKNLGELEKVNRK